MYMGVEAGADPALEEERSSFFVKLQQNKSLWVKNPLIENAEHLLDPLLQR